MRSNFPHDSTTPASISWTQTIQQKGKQYDSISISRSLYPQRRTDSTKRSDSIITETLQTNTKILSHYICGRTSPGRQLLRLHNRRLFFWTPETRTGHWSMCFLLEVRRFKSIPSFRDHIIAVIFTIISNY